MNRDKDFVPYKPSLDMKKLGFDEPCFGYFNVTKYLGIGSFVFKECNKNTIDGYGNHVLLRPTFSQAFRWFREKYDINCYIDCYFSIVHKGGKYHYHTMNGGSNGFFTYEEAELACLIKLIKMVKNK